MALVFLSPSAVRAQDLASAIVGVWKVVSIETKEVETGKRTSRPLRSAHDQRYISRRSSERPVLGLEARHQEALIRALLLARDRGGSAGRLSD